jgi:hypothetical protein
MEEMARIPATASATTVRVRPVVEQESTASVFQDRAGELFREALMRAPTILASLPLAFVLLTPVHAQEVRTGANAFGTW